MPNIPVAQCEQDCYNQLVNDMEKAKNAATHHIFGFIPWKDEDVFNPLKEAAKAKYDRCVERCKG